VRQAAEKLKIDLALYQGTTSVVPQDGLTEGRALALREKMIGNLHSRSG
jgi:hypothetical protein